MGTPTIIGPDVLGPTITSYNISGLSAGANLTLSVTASNTVGKGDAAAFPGSFYTHDIPAQPLPPILYTPQLPGVSTKTVVHIAWTPPFDYGMAIRTYTLSLDGPIGGIASSLRSSRNQTLDGTTEQVTPLPARHGMCTASNRG
jgi:hypothetical protein